MYVYMCVKYILFLQNKVSLSYFTIIFLLAV